MKVQLHKSKIIYQAVAHESAAIKNFYNATVTKTVFGNAKYVSASADIS